MLLGLWRSFEELEDSICIDELYALLNRKMEKEDLARKFEAKIHGMDIEDSAQSEETDVERIKREVEAELHGMSVEEYGERAAFSEAGIEVIVED